MIRPEFCNKVGMLCKIYLTDKPKERCYTYAIITKVNNLKETYKTNNGGHKAEHPKQVITMKFIDKKIEFRNCDKYIYLYNNQSEEANVSYRLLNEPKIILEKAEKIFL